MAFVTNYSFTSNKTRKSLRTVLVATSFPPIPPDVKEVTTVLTWPLVLERLFCFIICIACFDVHGYGCLEKNRPQATSENNSVAVQKTNSQSNLPEKPKTNERTKEKTSAPKKPDEGSEKGKMTASVSSTCKHKKHLQKEAKSIFRPIFTIKTFVKTTE